MPIRECNLTGNLAISPREQHPTYMVVGTAAQQLDASFDSSCKLSLFQLNLKDSEHELPLVATGVGGTRFSKLLWDGPSSGDEDLNGVIGAGTEKGELLLLSPSQLFKSGQQGKNIESSPILLQKKVQHTGSVMALDFNKFQRNLLASGAAESDIYIWDLNKMDTPMTPGTKSQPLDDVLDIAWNCKVQHILASTFRNRCVIWDLRKSDPIIRLTDSVMKMHCRSVRWHPNISTRLCVASDEDHTPWLQLWDLRYANSPVQSFENAASRGVTDLDWCPHDAGVLLSSARDGVVRAWNVEENSTSTDWIYHHSLAQECPQGGLHSVKWCPAIPGLYAAASFESGVHFLSVLGATGGVRAHKRQHRRSKAHSSVMEDAFGVASTPGSEKIGHEDDDVLISEPSSPDSVIRVAPQWMRRPCGSSFGFGGRLVRFSANEMGQVTCYHVVSDAQFVERCDRMKQWLPAAGTQNTGQQALHLCQTKLAELDGRSSSVANIEHSAWQFIQAHLHPTDVRSEFLRLLHVDGGHSVSDFLQSKWESSGSKQPLLSQPQGADSSVETALSSGLAEQHLSTADDADFFERVPPGAKVHPMSNGAAHHSDETTKRQSTEPLRLHVLPKDSAEGALCRALMTGKLVEAIDLCLLDGREGPALILAISSGDSSLYERVKRRIFTTASPQHQLSTQLLSATVDCTWENVVQRCDLHGLREMLACLLTYTQGESFTQLCQLLARRLEESGESQLMLDACLCYICCGDVENVARCWVQHLPTKSLHELQSVMEVLLGVELSVSQSTSQRASGETVRQLYHRYASVLVNEGRLLTALRYLVHVASAGTSGSSSQALSLLLDRTYYGSDSSVPREIIAKPPPKPFEIHRLRGAPVASYYHHQQQQSQQNRLSSLSSAPSQPGRLPGSSVPAPTAYQPSLPSMMAPQPSFQPVMPPPAAPFSRPPVPSNAAFQPIHNTFAPIRPPPIPGGSSTYGPSPPVPSFSGYNPATPPVSGFAPPPSFSRPQPPGPSTAFVPRPAAFAQPPPGPPRGGFTAPPIPTATFMSSMERSRTVSQSSHTTGHQSPAPSQQAMLPAALRSDLGGWNDPPMLLETNGESEKPAAPTPPPVNTFYNPAAFAATAPTPSFGAAMPSSNFNSGGPRFPSFTPQHQLQQQHQPQQVIPAIPPFNVAPPTQSAPPPPPPMAQVAATTPWAQTSSNGPAMSHDGVVPQQHQQLPVSAPIATSPAPVANVAPVVQVKAALSPEYEALRSVFSGLCDQCKTQSPNRQAKLKLEDVERRLENLYELLRGHNLSPSVVEGLQHVSSAATQRDYNSALNHINAVIQTANFAEIRTFMPAIKVLMQTAAQMNV